MQEILGVAAQLGLDNTIVPLFILMTVMYLFMSATYFRPFQKLLADRKHKTEGARNEAKDFVIRAEEKMNQYKTAIKGAHDTARKNLVTAEENAKREESAIIHDAQAKARSLVQSANAELEKQKKDVVDQLKNEIPAIAREIASKVLGRNV